MTDTKEKITVENVNVPGHQTRVDAAKYKATRKALLKVLPTSTPGLTQSQMFEKARQHLPESLFPGGAKSGWWIKTAQLDLEAKGLVAREKTKPLRWYKKRHR